MSDSGHDSVLVFCEGCGARLDPADRSCPKCGRPAPGILSAHSAASDLAAGKTASFPKLTPERIDAAGAARANRAGSDAFGDASVTSVLDADMLAGVSPAARPQSRSSSAAYAQIPRADVSGAEAEPSTVGDAYARRRHRGRWIALGVAACLLAGAGAFVALDPLGVMPGVYAQFEQAASEAFPSRQEPENPDAPSAQSADEKEDETGTDEPATQELTDATLSEDAAFERLSAIYERILGFQTALGPVVDDYNGYYIAKDRAQREQGSKSAYSLRDTIQATIDELKGLTLARDTAYGQDVDHLVQLCGWMYNRVDVLCRSWDISLGLSEGELPVDHQSDILKPLREVEMVNGKAVDVIEYEKNVWDWKPVQK